jgi:hypothetical protein
MDMKGFWLAALLAPCVAGPAWGDAVPPLVPATHEEIGGLIEGMAGQFQSLGDRLRGHFGGLPPGRERPLISIMLGHREELALTPAQVQALERLRTEFQKEAIRRDAEIRVAETDVSALLEADPVDLAKVEASVRQAERQRAEFRVARIRVIEEGKAQLTPEQRSKLAKLVAAPAAPTARPHYPSSPGRPERL